VQELLSTRRTHHARQHLVPRRSTEAIHAVLMLRRCFPARLNGTKQQHKPRDGGQPSARPSAASLTGVHVPHCRIARHGGQWIFPAGMTRSSSHLGCCGVRRKCPQHAVALGRTVPGQPSDARSILQHAPAQSLPRPATSPPAAPEDHRESNRSSLCPARTFPEAPKPKSPRST
jgi:hypothetical protein